MILDVRDITFGLADGFRILDAVSFSVMPGQTVGIIGPNGSGKTTLFNCISGFVEIQSGSLRFLREDITNMRPHERAARGLGRVFQSSGIFREMTLVENLLVALERKARSGMLPWHSSGRACREKALQFLGLVGLASRADEKASSLSGGQMRLLEITRTLACGAELFLLDEPTAGVSPKMKGDVAGLIGKLQELKKTVLVIEHDIDFIQKFCERIIVLNEGRVIMDDTPNAVRQSPLLQEIYFGKGG